MADTTAAPSYPSLNETEQPQTNGSTLKDNVANCKVRASCMSCTGHAYIYLFTHGKLPAGRMDGWIPYYLRDDGLAQKQERGCLPVYPLAVTAVTYT